MYVRPSVGRVGALVVTTVSSLSVNVVGWLVGWLVGWVGPCCPSCHGCAGPADATRLLLGCFAFRQRVNSAAAGVACVMNGNSVAGVFLVPD